MSQKYKKPPITEAIIEIQFEELIDDSLVIKAQRHFLKHYPTSAPVIDVAVHVKVGKDSARVEQKVTSQKLVSQDGAEIAILGASKFAVSQLAPYPGWQTLITRVTRDWGIWKSIVGYRRVRRIGVRYINRIDIPIETILGGKLQIEDYLNVSPRIPEEDDYPIVTYGMQLERPLGRDDCRLLINTGSMHSPLLNHLSFILDIDIIRDQNLPSNEGDLWSLIERIRTYKNEVFEKFVTDKSKELFY